MFTTWFPGIQISAKIFCQKNNKRWIMLGTIRAESDFRFLNSEFVKPCGEQLHRFWKDYFPFFNFWFLRNLLDKSNLSRESFMYRVSHSEIRDSKWLWGVEGLRISWTMVASGLRSCGHLNHQKSNFSLILALFLSEAVEASWCQFFENWWMKIKRPLLLKPIATIVQENSQFFFPSEPFSISHFTMRHPVCISNEITIYSSVRFHLFECPN